MMCAVLGHYFVIIDKCSWFLAHMQSDNARCWMMPGVAAMHDALITPNIVTRNSPSTSW